NDDFANVVAPVLPLILGGGRGGSSVQALTRDGTNSHGLLSLMRNSNEDACFRSLPIRASEIGWLVVEQRGASTDTQPGRICLRDVKITDETAASLDKRPLEVRTVPNSMVRFTIDLRELANRYGDEIVQVELYPPGGAEIVLRRFELRDH